MKLKITITLDNDAFIDRQGEECARILRELSNKLEHSRVLLPGIWTSLYDGNGNNIGSAKVSK